MCFLQGCALHSSGSRGVKGALSLSASRPKKVSSVTEVKDLSSSFSASLNVGLVLRPLLDFFDSDRLIA
jgi:hypothetical protein